MHIAITSSTRKQAPRADLTINCANLPNPHQVPGLRPRDGRNPMVKDWLNNQPGVTEFIDQQLQRILHEQPSTITTTCNAGRHRSVMVAEALAAGLQERGHTTMVTHLELEKPKQPRRDGMGWRHQKRRRQLNAQLKDGEACWWCGRPMHREHVLHADHSESRKHAGIESKADRLLHGACNEQRGAGEERDGRRPALNLPGCFEALPIRLKAGGTDTRYELTNGSQRASTAAEPPSAPVSSFVWG